MSAVERITADMERLSRIEGRIAGSDGERAMLQEVRERLPASVRRGPGPEPVASIAQGAGLPPPDATTAKIEGLVAHTKPALAIGLHAATMLAGGLLGIWRPDVGLFVCSVVTASLLAHGAGRTNLWKVLMPKDASYNLVVRTGHPLGTRIRGTLVLSAPLDVPRWRAPSWLRPARAARGLLFAAIAVSAMLLHRWSAEPWGPLTWDVYGGLLGVFALGVVISSVTGRPGSGRDEAAGPAVLLEVMRRFEHTALPDLDVWYVFTGAGRAGHGGMEAFLDLHRRSLVEPVLVVALSDPARPPLSATVTEGALFPLPQKPAGPALVERLGWAGVAVPIVDHVGTTDAWAALVRGIRAVGLVGGRGRPEVAQAARAADVVERLARLWEGDLHRIEAP